MELIFSIENHISKYSSFELEVVTSTMKWLYSPVPVPVPVPDKVHTYIHETNSVLQSLYVHSIA